MLSRLRFRWHASRHRYAHALASLDDRGALAVPGALYAAYRLGLYCSVADAPAAPSDRRDLIAVAVSLAACGRSDEAAALVQQLLARADAASLQVQLAVGLAPYLPALALECLPAGGAPSTLRAALLLRIGRVDEARDTLQALPGDSAHAEAGLYLAMAMAQPPAQQLAGLNRWLALHVLSAVALQDDTQPPGANNLRSAGPVAALRGPLVSVLMTAYQSAGRIESAVRSVLAQSWQDIELIVVDDASSDGTYDVLQRMAALDRRVRPLRMANNAGTYVAKNLALQHASGEFVTCHDSDDWSHPQKIALQVKPLIDNPRKMFSTSLWVRLGDDGRCFAQQVHPLARQNMSSVLFRRCPVLEHAGAWDPVRIGADSEFHARLGLVFGRASRHRVALPLAFGAHRAGSLVTAADTGFGSTGLSAPRLAYTEAWGHWHIGELRAGRRPKIATEHAFSGPGLMIATPPDSPPSQADVDGKRRADWR
jgi:Glycosyl transferase family 2